MHIAALVLVLLYCIAVVAYDGATGKAEYAKFKRLTDTIDRQRFYMHWLIKSALMFLVVGIIALAILGRLRGLLLFPQEFAAAHATLTKLVPPSQVSHQFLVMIGLGILAGAVMGGVAAGIVQRKKQKTKLVIGDIEALFPRNGAEMLRTALLSLNAGLSEELFFRLLLPLALVGLFGNPVACFLGAAVLFGLPHIYQGAVGCIGATVLGLVLTAIYVATGSLWIAMAVHAAIDLNTLVLRPAITWLVQGKVKSNGDQPIEA